MHMTGLRDKKNLFSFSKKEMSCLSLKNKASLHYYFIQCSPSRTVVEYSKPILKHITFHVNLPHLCSVFI